MTDILQKQQLSVSSVHPQPDLSLFRVALPTGVNLHYVFKQAALNQPLQLGTDRIDQAIILIPGYSDSWRSFEEMLKLFAASAVTQPVFALDMRGHGESFSALDAYTQADFADDIAAFMDSLNIGKATVMGHSMGGLIAHKFAVAYPEKVNGLVLIATAATMAGSPLTAELKSVIDGFDDASPAPTDFVEAFQASTFYKGAEPRVLYRYISDSLKLKGRVWKATLNDLDQEDHRDQLRKIAAPVLILWGERDSVFSEAEQIELRDLIPNSELVIVPDAGHALNVERSEEIVEAISEFINEVIRD